MPKSDDDVTFDPHPHLLTRMEQRGATMSEVQRTIANGSRTEAAKPGSHGRVSVFPFDAEWEGRYYDEKEVTVFYKFEDDRLVPLTVITRYGRFSQRSTR